MLGLVGNGYTAICCDIKLVVNDCNVQEFMKLNASPYFMLQIA